MAPRSKSATPRRASPKGKQPGRAAQPRSRPTLSGPSLFDLFNRRTGILFWLGGIGVWLIFIFAPVSNSVTRGGSVILAGVTLLGLLAFWWRVAVLRWSVLLVCAAATIFWFLPGRELYDRDSLRQSVSRALRSYDGVRYFWGGENHLGIDCSGLVRRGAIEGTLKEGFRTGNSLLVRRAVLMWWRDMSARDMGFGAKRSARRLMQVKAIKGFDDSKLRPGDFAVPEGGVHVMAYLGNHLWIEANPSLGKVVIEDGRTTSNPWFNMPVSIMRWRYMHAYRPDRSFLMR
jgi:hypothetical protein